MLNLYPDHIFYEKVVNQITHRKNKLWRFLPSARISLSGIDTIPNKYQFRERILRLLGDGAEVVNQISPKDNSIILESANQTLAHEFDYLGSGTVHMSSVKWHEDFKTGNTWQKGIFYLNQRRSTKKGADIKVPWELSRGHHLLWLGEAYLITKDEKYSKEVVDEIEDWLNENPFMHSVNWTCTMDVAIRAVNWMYAVGMVMESPIVNDSFIAKLYQSLYQHSWFIFNNLEQTIPYSNNHLFSDIAGLVYLSLFFNSTKKGKKWHQYAVSALYKEIRCQVLPSGVHYERSVSYHRLMTEMVMASLTVLKRNGVNIPADIEYRAGSMLSYIQSYTKPNHLSPLVEDNDDGRFLPFVRRDFRQHDYLLDSSTAEMLFLNNGNEAIPYELENGSRLYGDAGHAVLRKGEAYLFVTNGEQSSYESSRQTVGTHTHNDKLSFDLVLGEDDVIVDPGAYIYTPDPVKSNEFRSTIKHNTVVVDNEEQNGITPNNVFLATKNSRSTRFRMLSDSCVDGEYITFKGSLTHSRKFEINNSSLLITDFLHKTGGKHQAVFSFHLAEQILPVLIDREISVSTEHFDIKMTFASHANDFAVEIVDDTVSPSYGVLRSSKTVRLKLSFEESIEFNTNILWQKKK